MSQETKVKEYSNGEVTVVWQPSLCVHSENCIKGLPSVFNLEAKPWINVEGAGTQAIVDQVQQCPSGALSHRMEQDAPQAAEQAESEPTRIEVIPNGPVAVSGPAVVSTSEGETTIERPKVFLCRCGHSQNKPYCDGSHKKVDFQAP